MQQAGGDERVAGLALLGQMCGLQGVLELRHGLAAVLLGASPYDVAIDADAVNLLTEWNEFKQLDLVRIRESMARPILVDGRNMYDPERLRNLGFIYISVGRGEVASRLRETVPLEGRRVLT